MRVEVRALIAIDGKIVVAREQRHGQPRLSLPGGRVEKLETVEHALIREVREETGLEVEIGALAYVTEVVKPGSLQDLNLVFLATPIAPIDAEALTLLIPSGNDSAVMPPLLGRIAEDLRSGEIHRTQWLGNIWRA